MKKFRLRSEDLFLSSGIIYVVCISTIVLVLCSTINGVDSSGYIDAQNQKSNYTESLWFSGPCPGNKCSTKTQNNMTLRKKANLKSSSNKMPNLQELEKTMRKKLSKCDKKGTKNANMSFLCTRLNWSSWLLDQMKKNSTELNSFIHLVHVQRSNLDSKDLLPENWPENIIYNLLKSWGDASDKFLFFKMKEFSKSRELKVTVPQLATEVAIEPRTHPDGFSGRTLFDPGFNLKMKLPFFRDELKFAVSTGPSFIAGLGLGLIILGIKAIFGPMILAIKYMILSLFIKDLSPFDIFKIFGGGGWSPPPPPPPPIWDEPIGGYESSHHHHFENPHDKSNSYTFYPYDGKGKNVGGGGSPISVGSEGHEHFVEGDGRTKYLTEESNNLGEKRFPAEDFDPFYSPLLSRIDSIFTHLGFANDEGCKERAVCSIYKFPVKYAPYSNLLSAQLSKHQSELKRPVSTSPKVLRYFKYMKAAKDGQGGLNCIELYPNCTSDTEKLSNLPMVKTFQQLTELMGTGAGTGSG